MDAEETAATLPYKQLVDAMEEILRDKVAGRITAPVPSVTPLGTVGTLETTTFIDGDVAVVDVRTLHPANPSAGEPFVQGSVLLHDVRTGRLLRTLDGTTFTARRAAAVSALAARVLAPDPTGRMMVVGAGTLARAHMQAFHDALGTSEAFVLSRSEHRAMQAVEFARRIGMRARAVDLSTATVDYVTLIVTATTSVTPIVFGRVRDDGFVAAVGSYRADMAELPEELVHRGFLFIDNPEQAHLRAGDFVNAGIDLSTVFPLEAVLDAARPGTGPVVFENCGDYLFDIAAVRTSLSVKPPTPEEWGREPTPAEAEVLRPERIALPKAQPGQLPRGGPIEMGPAGRDRGVEAGASGAKAPRGPIPVGPVDGGTASSEPIPVGPVGSGPLGAEADAGDAQPPTMNGSAPGPVAADTPEPPVAEVPVEQPVDQVPQPSAPAYEPPSVDEVPQPPAPAYEPPPVDEVPPVFAPPVEQQSVPVYEPPPAYDPPPVEQVPQPPAPAYDPPLAYDPPVEQPSAPAYDPPPAYDASPAYAPPVEPVARNPVDPNLPPLAPQQPDVAVPAWAPPQFDPTSPPVEPPPVVPPNYPPVQQPAYEPPAQTPPPVHEPPAQTAPPVHEPPAQTAPPVHEPPAQTAPPVYEPPAPQVPPPPPGVDGPGETPEPPDPEGGRVWVPPVS